MIPQQVDRRNSELMQYIERHKVTDMHETQLPCILNSNFYKQKLQNYTETTILKRLQAKQNQEGESAFGQTRPAALRATVQKSYGSQKYLSTSEYRENNVTEGTATSFMGRSKYPYSKAVVQGRPAATSAETEQLKAESMIRRNKLTLEHIMHERGKNVAEAEVLADLHRQLRNLERKEKQAEIITVSRGQKGKR